MGGACQKKIIGAQVDRNSRNEKVPGNQSWSKPNGLFDSEGPAAGNSGRECCSTDSFGLTREPSSE